MGNLISNAYEAPVSLSLLPAEREEVYVKRRVNEAVRLAKKTAKQYAGVVMNQCEAQYGLKACDVTGSESEIAQTMRVYGVNKVLCEYAARLVVRYLNEKGVR